MLNRNQLPWLAAFVAIAGCGSPVELPPALITLTSNQTPAFSAATDPAFRTVGVGSCTASGCHGSGSATMIAGSEYNIWVSNDPHADAHSVLYDEASLAMVRRLDGKGPDATVAPYEDRRCLGCHSTTMAPPRDRTVNQLSDGVGCEACHGPAERWLSTHYEHRFNGSGTASNRAALHKLGFRNTDDLVTRAQICAGCHVGEAGRDVNHDLIAAGHPRLQFDFGVYYRRLPMHWDVTEDRRNYGDKLEALTWAIGQAVNSQAALKRLAARAETADIWPELSEWSCGACHHDLRDDAARQQRLAARGGLSGLQLAWDDWHHHLPRHYLQPIERAWGVDPQLAGEIEHEMGELAILAGDLRGDRQEISKRATALCVKLERWIDALRQVNPDADAMARLTREIVAVHQENGLASWSEAALAYDALASVHQSRLDGARANRVADPTSRQVTAAIGELFNELSRTGGASGADFRPEHAAPHLERLNALLNVEKGPE